MASTYQVRADLGAAGLAGTAGFVVYNAADASVFQTRAASVSTIAAVGSSTVYQGSFSGAAGASYFVIWDDGGSPPNYSSAGDVNPGVNVAAIGNTATRVGDGTATAVATGTITLDANDPASGTDKAGWQVRILSATAGVGQVALIASSNTSTRVQTLAASWVTTPTGVVVYELIPPFTATATLGSTAPAGWINAGAIAAGALTSSAFATGALAASAFATDAIGAAAVSSAAVTKLQAGLTAGDTPGTTTLLARLTGARAGYLDGLNPATGVTLAATQALYAPARAGDSMGLVATAADAIMIESHYTLKQAVKVILATVGNTITGNGTTTVVVGNAMLPTPTTGATTVITSTMTGVALVNNVPTAVDRTAVQSVQLSNV